MRFWPKRALNKDNSYLDSKASKQKDYIQCLGEL